MDEKDSKIGSKTITDLIIEACVLVFIATLIIVPVCGFMLTDGSISYCYITPNTWASRMWSTKDRVINATYTLHGFRRWNFDRTLATDIASVDDAKKIADTLGCTIR